MPEPEVDPVAAFIAAIAGYGVLGLLALGLAERFIPVLPSYGMLAAIGAASADGVWPLWLAIVMTTFGGILGLALGLRLLDRLGQERARAMISAIARPIGLRDQLAQGWAARARASTASVAFTLQLVPTVRFLAPLLAILAGMGRRRFLVASTFGAALWNGTFIGVGYVSASFVQMDNATQLAATILAALLALQFGVLQISRSLQARRRLR